MKKTSSRWVTAMITLALAGGAAEAAGCGGASTASLCGDICACKRCTANDLEACKTDGVKASDAADAAGCSSQFDDAVACSSANVSCKGDQAVSAGCEAENAALTKCSSALSVFGKNLCERAADVITTKYAACGGKTVDTSTGSGSSAECTDAAGTLLTCQAGCYAAADCSIIVADSNKQPTSEQVKAYTDCATTCQ